MVSSWVLIAPERAYRAVPALAADRLHESTINELLARTMVMDGRATAANHSGGQALDLEASGGPFFQTTGEMADLAETVADELAGQR